MILATLLGVLLVIFGYGISWLIFIGIAKLIALCFGIAFSLPVVTGIWLIVCLIKLCFGKVNKKE